MKKAIILISLTIASQIAIAQIDTAAIRQFLISEPTRSELIQKCRSRITKAVTEGDRDRAAELMFYAKTTFEDDNYQVFYPDEFWDLAIWLRKYKLAASEMSLFDSISAAQFNNHINTLYGLHYLLRNQINSDKEFFEKDICSDSSLTSCERDFLLLYLKRDFTHLGRASLRSTPSAVTELDSLLIDTNNFEIWDSEAMNSASNNFLEQYPASQFELFVRNFLRHEYKKSGFMYGGHAGLGAMIVKGDLNEILSGAFNVQLGFNGSFKRIVVGAEINLSAGHKVRENFLGNDAFYEEGLKITGVYPCFYLGYRFSYRSIMLLPSVGYGGFRIEPVDDEFKDCAERSSWAPVLSIEAAYETNEIYRYDSYALRNILAFGLKYSYHPVKFEFRDGDYSGVTHTISLVYRKTAGKSKRIY